MVDAQTEGGLVNEGGGELPEDDVRKAESNLSCRLHPEMGLALMSISIDMLTCTPPSSIMSLPLTTVASLLVIGCGGVLSR